MSIHVRTYIYIYIGSVMLFVIVYTSTGGPGILNLHHVPYKLLSSFSEQHQV